MGSKYILGVGHLSPKFQMHGVGKLRSREGVLFVRFSTTSSSRRQCDGGGGSGLFSDSDSFYQLCQLSALSASILRLSEQPKLVPQEAEAAKADGN